MVNQTFSSKLAFFAEDVNLFNSTNENNLNCSQLESCSTIFCLLVNGLSYDLRSVYVSVCAVARTLTGVHSDFLCVSIFFQLMDNDVVALVKNVIPLRNSTLPPHGKSPLCKLFSGRNLPSCAILLNSYLTIFSNYPVSSEDVFSRKLFC